MELMSSFQNKICYANIKTCAHMLKTYRKKTIQQAFWQLFFLWLKYLLAEEMACVTNEILLLIANKFLS